MILKEKSHLHCEAKGKLLFRKQRPSFLPTALKRASMSSMWHFGLFSGQFKLKMAADYRPETMVWCDPFLRIFTMTISKLPCTTAKNTPPPQSLKCGCRFPTRAIIKYLLKSTLGRVKFTQVLFRILVWRFLLFLLFLWQQSQPAVTTSWSIWHRLF